MEGKRGAKHSRSPSAEGSPLPEVSSCYPCSPVFEHKGPSGKAPVVDLSSSPDEESLILDTSQDAEFARRLFSDLNRDVLGWPNDDKVIILSDSDEEEEVREETVDAIDVVPSTLVKSLAPTASAANIDEDPKGMQDDNSDALAPDREISNSISGGDEAGSP
jgi:hypothetical protein